MIKEIYEQMKKEDKIHAASMDFEGLYDEIYDKLNKLVDMIRFGHADIEDAAIIDATMTTISDILSESVKLVENRRS